jgi:hypothetical protein
VALLSEAVADASRIGMPHERLVAQRLLDRAGLAERTHR